MFNINKHFHNYHYNKLTVIDNILPKDICQNVVERIERLVISKKVIDVNFKGVGTIDILDGGGEYKYKVMDMEKVIQYFPELVLFYYSMLPLISVITHTEVITSPHPGSEIVIKVYEGSGATQGWHYDTNAITALLYLTTNQEGSTSCKIQKHHPSQKELKTKIRKIYPRAGSLLLMKGREVWHCSEPLINEVKIVVPFNYYLKNDIWRPSGIDDLIYGRNIQ
jgi:hypothetical protein